MTTPDGKPLPKELDDVVGAFFGGYNAAIEDPDAARLASTLDSAIPLALRGFAYEGAGMGLAMLDSMTPWNRRRFDAMLSGPAGGRDTTPGILMIIGKGLATVFGPGRLEAAIRRAPPTAGHWIADGHGFACALRRPERTIDDQRIPRAVPAEWRRAFDNGVGRFVWFRYGCEPSGVADAIGRFDAERRRDLWVGIGVACGYAGGADLAAIRQLCALAGEHRVHLAEGVSIAALARHRHQNVTANVEMVSEAVCGIPVAAAADIAREAFDLEPDDGQSHYRAAYELMVERMSQLSPRPA